MDEDIRVFSVFYYLLLFSIYFFFIKRKLTLCLIQQPQVGNTVKPKAVTATGTSWLQGKALEHTQQQHCT